tara:strand:+ start:473 stop:1765 length:1293 start_codon:yes stop_codon:yes gene_type:complete
MIQKIQVNKKNKLIITASLMPFTLGNKEAANVITHQIIKNLIAEEKYEIYFCLISHEIPEKNTYSDSAANSLEKLGVKFLNPLIIPKYKKKSIIQKIGFILSGSPEKIFPGAEVQNKLANYFGFKPDLILVIWSELATHACSKIDCKKYNYAGNSQHDVYAARYELSELEFKSRSKRINILKQINFKLRHFFIKYAYIHSLKRYDLIWNVAFNDAISLRKKGVNAQYLQNMWPNSNYKINESIKNNKDSILKIVANVGNINATGNSLGLYVLASEILPRMKKIMKDKRFEFHLFGRGEPLDFLKDILNDPQIKIRGFVNDLDSEIISSDIFLVTNNSKRFKVCHTRFLHAWSLSSCVVAFRDSSLAIPEIIDGYNALLGDNSNQICDLIIKCANDNNLKRDLAKNGMKTLKNYFNPKNITAEISSVMINN